MTDSAPMLRAHAPAAHELMRIVAGAAAPALTAEAMTLAQANFSEKPPDMTDRNWLLRVCVQVVKDHVAEDDDLRPETAELQCLAPLDRLILGLRYSLGVRAELPIVLGTTTRQTKRVVTAAEQRAAHRTGALLVARHNRSDCEDLHASLLDWDGDVSPIITRRTARHVEVCEICQASAALHDPLAHFATVTALPVPDTAYVAAADRSLDLHPFVRRIGRRAIGATVLVLVVVLVVAMVLRTDDSPVTLAADRSGSSADPATVTTTTALSALRPVPGRVGPAPTTDPEETSTTSTAPVESSTTTAAPAAVRFGLSRTTLRVGPARPPDVVTLTNRGSTPFKWNIASGGFVRAQPSSGTLSGGQAIDVVFTLADSAAPEGDIAEAAALFVEGTDPTQISASIERAPTVTASSAEATVHPEGSGCPETSVISAQVSDESAIRSVTLSWWQAATPESVTTSPMTLTDGTWMGQVGPFADETNGDLVWSLTATDSRGNATTHPEQTIDTEACP